MMKGWKEVRLEDLCIKVQSGGTPSTKREEYYGGNIPWVKTKEVKFNRIYESEFKITELGLKNSSAKLIPSRSILIAMYGNGDTAGRCAINIIPLATNQACSNFTFDESLAIPEFMFYKILTHYKDFVHLKSGGAQNNLNGKTLKEFKVILPPLPTQRKIASILSAYDDLIENNLKRIKLLEEKAQLTYEEWFVRMKFPGHENAVVNEETGLPEGWEKVKLGELVSLQQGFALNKKSDHYISNVRTNYPLLKISDLFRETETLFVKDTIPKQFLVDTDEIIYSRTGQVGHAFMGRKGVIYNNCFRITPNEKINSQLLYLILISPTVIEIAKGLATGAAQPDLNHGAFKSIKTILPPMEVQNMFFEQVKSIKPMVSNIKKQNQLLKEERDILLPRLMTGMIDVDKIEIGENLTEITEA